MRGAILGFLLLVLAAPSAAADRSCRCAIEVLEHESYTDYAAVLGPGLAWQGRWRFTLSGGADGSSSTSSQAGTVTRSPEGPRDLSRTAYGGPGRDSVRAELVVEDGAGRRYCRVAMVGVDAGDRRRAAACRNAWSKGPDSVDD